MSLPRNVNPIDVVAVITAALLGSYAFVVGWLLGLVLRGLAIRTAGQLRRGVTIGWDFRDVSIATSRGDSTICAPNRMVRLERDHWRSPGPSGRPPFVLELLWNIATRVELGEMLWTKRWSLAFMAPVRLRWRRNDSYTRHWTGRERELAAVDYWTPRGWCRRVFP